MTRLALALILLAAPAWAQDKPNLDPTAPAQPGAVALYLSARALSDQGIAAKDPLMVLTAARMLRSVNLTPVARQPLDNDTWTASALPPADPLALFDTARSLDAGGNFADLIEIMSRETPPPPRALPATASTLDPGAADNWTLSFFGGTYAEIGMAGAHTGNLDLTVTDAAGTPVCTDNGAADTAYCGFVPRENGDVTVTVINSGTTPDAYVLLTN